MTWTSFPLPSGYYSLLAVEVAYRLVSMDAMGLYQKRKWSKTHPHFGNNWQRTQEAVFPGVQLVTWISHIPEEQICFDISQESSPNKVLTSVCTYIWVYYRLVLSCVSACKDSQASMCWFNIFMYVHVNWCLLKPFEPGSVWWVLVIVWCDKIPTSSWS